MENYLESAKSLIFELLPIIVKNAFTPMGFVPILLPILLAIIAPLVSIRIIGNIKSRGLLIVSRFFLSALVIGLGMFIGIKIHLANTDSWGFEFFSTPFFFALALLISYIIISVKTKRQP